MRSGMKNVWQIIHSAMKYTAALFVFVAACAVCALSGCADSGSAEEYKPSPDQLDGLVVGVQKTQNVPNYTTSFADPYIAKAQEEHCQVDLVVIDGKPYSLINTPLDLGSNAANSTNVAKENKATRADACALFDAATGKTPELNLIDFFLYADRSLASSKNGGTVVLVSSGLSTAGAFDCSQDGVLTVDGVTMANYLESQGFSLAHTKKVVWYGFGDVAGEQKELTPDTRKSLMEAWEQSLLGMGVQDVVFEDARPNTINEGESAVAVTCVDVPELERIVVVSGETTRLTSDKVSFKPGSAEFLDEETANLVVAPFADYMLQHEQSTAVISGSTASYLPDPEFPAELGYHRAQAVADILIAAGVEESRIQVESWGDNAPDHVYDLDENGVQIPWLAQQNRYVSIVVQ